uniref:Uncharacterized protein n=1 Tax=Knipowitschia caucasica TaxID=637954 RepID=A0AAV2KXT4_KNICA
MITATKPHLLQSEPQTDHSFPSPSPDDTGRLPAPKRGLGGGDSGQFGHRAESKIKEDCTETDKTDDEEADGKLASQQEMTRPVKSAGRASIWCRGRGGILFHEEFGRNQRRVNQSYIIPGACVMRSLLVERLWRRSFSEARQDSSSWPPSEALCVVARVCPAVARTRTENLMRHT